MKNRPAFFTFHYQTLDFSSKAQPINPKTNIDYLRKTIDEKLVIKHQSIKRKPFDWHTECLIAARQIAKQTKKQIVICLNGEIETEVVAEAFRLAKVTFKVAILRMKDQLNIHAVAWSTAYCERNRINYFYVDIDVKSYLFSQTAIMDAQKYQCVSPELLCYVPCLNQLQKLNYFPVLGFFDFKLKKETQQNLWNFTQQEQHLSLLKLQKINQHTGVYQFFRWSAELFYSFFAEETIMELMQNTIADVMTQTPLEALVIRNNFNLAKRDKYLSNENLEKINKQMQATLNKHLPGHNAVFEIPCLTEFLPSINPTEFKNPNLEDTKIAI